MANDWCVLKNNGTPDKYTARVPDFHGWLGQPMPFLRSHARQLNVPHLPIPDVLAYRLAEAVMARGGTIGDAERKALGLDREACC